MPAETVQGKSRYRFLLLFILIKQEDELAPALKRECRERLLVLFGNIFLVWFENRTLLKCKSQSVGTMQTQDCYTWSWSYKS